MTSKDGFTQFSATAQPWLGSVNTQPAKKQTELPTRNKHPTTGPLLKVQHPTQDVSGTVACSAALACPRPPGGGFWRRGSWWGCSRRSGTSPGSAGAFVSDNFPESMSRGFILPVWRTHLLVVFFVSCIFPHSSYRHFFHPITTTCQPTLYLHIFFSTKVKH